MAAKNGPVSSNFAAGTSTKIAAGTNIPASTETAAGTKKKC